MSSFKPTLLLVAAMAPGAALADDQPAAAGEQWNAHAIVSYRWTLAGYDVFAGAGYRALCWDYQHGGFEWDVTMSGPMVGGGIRT